MSCENEIIEINVSQITEVIEVSYEACEHVVNIVSGVGIDPSNYDLSDFNNDGANYFIQVNQLTGLLSDKVDKEEGKTLISLLELAKLAGIEAGAEVNVNADWNATSGDAEILNKPTLLQGLSAYEVAVQNGFVGTETQWLASLKGDKGNTGLTGFSWDISRVGANGYLVGEIVNYLGNYYICIANNDALIPTASLGVYWNPYDFKGADGDDGLSAYQVAVANGFFGTELQWLDSLKAKNYTKRHQFTINNSYCGIAIEESLVTDNVWKITRITIAVNGTTTIGTATNVNWVDYLTHTYE